jgi:hypothetical protein
MVRWIEFPLGTGFYGGLAILTLPGVNSLTDGMIFATSSDGSSDIRIIGAAPANDGSGWLMTIREDSAADAETLVLEDQSEFQFLYVPYDAQGLIGGHINGANGSVNNSSGEFTLTRTGTGAYNLVTARLDAEHDRGFVWDHVVGHAATSCNLSAYSGLSMS